MSAWILMLVFAGLWLAAIAQMGRMQRRLDALEAERTRLRAENEGLHAVLRGRMQAHNYPYGFRLMLPSLREWPN